MSLPFSSSAPADSKEKRDECTSAGKYIKILLEMDLKPRDIITKTSFENAISIVMVTGGSTNAVLHLIAMSRATKMPETFITIDDFQRISDRTPFLADLKPSGKYVMEDIQNIGGTPGIIKFMIDNDMFDGDQMTVTGRTHNQNLKDMNHPGLTEGQEVIRPLSNPIKPTGHLQIMYGNLCPLGGVAKITGKEGETFTVSCLCSCLLRTLCCPCHQFIYRLLACYQLSMHLCTTMYHIHGPSHGRMYIIKYTMA